MASLIYDSYIYDAITGAVDTDTDTFYGMLVTASYTAAKTHAKRSDITNELAAAGGYAAGGIACALSVVKDTVNHKVDVTLGTISWAAATLSAAGLVVYKRRGGASSADELVAFIDFGGTIVSTNGTFQVTASTVRIQN